jgi:cytochrome c oxidase subunit 2
MSLLHLPLAAALAAGPGYLPERASSVAEGVDRLFGFIFWVSLFFLALIVVLTVVFVARYRVRPGRTAADPSPAHSTRLELLWSGLPLALVLVMFGWSTRVWLDMARHDLGPAPHRVQVTARKWSWWFDHPGGRGSNELHLVAGRPTELVLGAVDVIHSLYVPEFRLKQDAVPGRYTRMAFTPIRPGTYAVVCAEFCGTNHSRMNAAAVVHPDQASFDAWASQGGSAGLSLQAQGEALFAEKGCSACHSVDGSPGVGPSMKGLFGRAEKLTSGPPVQVDENYLRESIVKPGARVVAGYDDVMPPMPLEERELAALIAYIQSLKEAP